MIIGLIHLSDIHIKSKDDAIIARIDKLLAAFREHLILVDNIFIILSGDLVFSGEKLQYEIFKDFINSLKSKIKYEFNKDVHIIPVPGNHDCNFNYTNSIRNITIDQIYNEGESVIDEDVINECCKVQKDYFEFENDIIDSDNLIYGDKLIKILNYRFDNFNLIFHLYNSAWISKKSESQGRLLLPSIDKYEEHLSNKANYIISNIHHPFNWFESENSRKCKGIIESCSDFIFSGHEHYNSISLKSDFKDSFVEYLEGGILNDNDDGNNSSFNILLLELEKKEQRAIKYLWHNDHYSLQEYHDGWKPFLRTLNKMKDEFPVSKDFNDYLNDPGATFYHPNKSNLSLDDIFIFPYLISLHDNNDSEPLSFDKNINSEVLVNNILEFKKLIIVGQEQSCKTTLLKVIFKKLVKSDMVPVLLDGININTTSKEKLLNLIKKYFEKQYSNHFSEKYDQLTFDKKVLIVDNFDRVSLNSKYSTRLLKSLLEIFPNIIITGSDLFQLQELFFTDEDNVQENILNKFSQFRILQFGYLLRRKMIERWNYIGIDENYNEKDLLRKNDEAQYFLDTIIGKNYIPSYPIFILSILQTIETSLSHDFSNSLYGYYYELLITNSLGKVVKRNEILYAYNNYISELCYKLFYLKKKTWQREFWNDFHKLYLTHYDVDYSSKELYEVSIIEKNLKNANIIAQEEGVFSIKHKYVYYYYVAKYLADHIEEEEIRILIDKLSRRVYRTEFANILMFLTHLSKNSYILEKIVSNSKSIFNEFKPLMLNDDVKILNGFIDTLPKLVLQERNVKEEREKRLELQDQVDSQIPDIDEATEDMDVDEDISNLNILFKLNLAFKTIELLGQIAKKYYGSLKSESKLSLIDETYSLGLRSLNVFFDIVQNHSEIIIEEIKGVIDEKGINDPEKIKKMSKKILFGFCNMMAFTFIKKISNSIGTENLSRTFRKIATIKNTNAIRLINVSIRLDHYKEFPLDALTDIKKDLDGNVLGILLLKQLVIDYLYMFPVDISIKQKICELLDISIEYQRNIQLSSKRLLN
jgi:hypothetical protein